MAIFCNSDYSYKFFLTNRDKTPVNLPSTAAFEIKLINTTTDTEVLFTTENGRLLLDAPNGAFSIVLLAAYTNTLTPGEYKMVCHRTDSQRSRLFTGLIKIKPEEGD